MFDSLTKIPEDETNPMIGGPKSVEKSMSYLELRGNA